MVHKCPGPGLAMRLSQPNNIVSGLRSCNLSTGDPANVRGYWYCTLQRSSNSLIEIYLWQKGLLAVEPIGRSCARTSADDEVDQGHPGCDRRERFCGARRNGRHEGAVCGVASCAAPAVLVDGVVSVKVQPLWHHGEPDIGPHHPARQRPGRKRP